MWQIVRGDMTEQHFFSSTHSRGHSKNTVIMYNGNGTPHPSHLAALVIFLEILSITSLHPQRDSPRKKQKTNNNKKSQPLYFDISLGITAPLSQSDFFFSSRHVVQFCLFTGGKTAKGFQQNICWVLAMLDWADAHAKRKKKTSPITRSYCVLRCVCVCERVCTCMHMHVSVCAALGP